MAKAGGKARAAALTKDARSSIASKAASHRWKLWRLAKQKAEANA